MAYTSQYPTQDDDHVKTTTKRDTDFWAYFTTDPAKSLTGVGGGNQWCSVLGTITNQRFHIDLSSGKIIRRIYYENSHHEGGHTDQGVTNFTLWGSNTAAAFAELTYGTDTNWTELTVAQNTFDRHSEADEADPKYITVTNSVEYRYYALKFVDCYGDDSFMSVRRIELQTEDGYTSKELSGAFTLTGNVVKLPKIALAGVFSLTGTVSSILRYIQSLAGVFTLTGVVGRLTKKTLSGVFTLTGNVVKLPKIALSGVFSLTGNVVKLPKIALSGVFTLTGSIYFKQLYTKITKAVATYTKIAKDISTYLKRYK